MKLLGVLPLGLSLLFGGVLAPADGLADPPQMLAQQNEALFQALQRPDPYAHQ
jgi:hypothetical protein